MMSMQQQSTLPLTVAGRSPFDSPRLRWGGIGTVVGGAMLMFSGPAGIVFGILVAALGIASLYFSALGAVYWYDIPSPQRYVVGTGAFFGFLLLILFLGATRLISSAVVLFTRDR